MGVFLTAALHVIPSLGGKPEGEGIARIPVIVPNRQLEHDPLQVIPWSREEEEELQRLKECNVPMEETTAAVATTQNSNAVVDNENLLDEETNLKVFQALQESMSGAACTATSQDDGATSI